MRNHNLNRNQAIYGEVVTISIKLPFKNHSIEKNKRINSKIAEIN